MKKTSTTKTETGKYNTLSVTKTLHAKVKKAAKKSKLSLRKYTEQMFLKAIKSN